MITNAHKFLCSTATKSSRITRTNTRMSSGNSLLNHYYLMNQNNSNINRIGPNIRSHGSNLFSTVAANNYKSVRILYGSQGGTAQLFAQQLAEGIEEEMEEIETAEDLDVAVLGFDQDSPPDVLVANDDTLNVLLMAVTGVGEPTDNARDFYQWLMNDATAANNVKYTVFGLGNARAHPNNYNVIGKGVDAKLETLGANRVFPLGLGDDGDCIEDDFDNWMESFMEQFKQTSSADTAAATTTESVQEEEEEAPPAQEEAPQAVVDDSHLYMACENDGVAKCLSGKRRISEKYPTLTLESPQTDMPRNDLLGVAFSNDKQIYSSETVKLPILSNHSLNPNATENALHELQISLALGGSASKYEAGDHIKVYPRNAQALVEAYLQQLDVHPHCIIQEAKESSSKYPYPYPTGITVSETLSHCVDLGAVPSPAFARLLLGRKDIDYKNEVANSRRTALDLLLETSADNNNKILSLEDLLYNLTPMRPRYYSIASSPKVNPHKIYLTYRPVQYLTNRGNMRLGTSTHYMASLVGAGATASHVPSHIVAELNKNPTFRMPLDPKTPVLMVAGGCGVAPIRSFLEQRIYYAKHEHCQYGEGYVFLGFRNPNDEAYQDLIEEAMACGAITHVHTTYNNGVPKGASPDRYSQGNVTEAVGLFGETIWNFFESGGYTYLCGGARTFGVAIENQVLDIFQKHGQRDLEGAKSYLQNLYAEGRFHEDLAD